MAINLLRMVFERLKRLLESGAPLYFQKDALKEKETRFPIAVGRVAREDQME